MMMMTGHNKKNYLNLSAIKNVCQKFFTVRTIEIWNSLSYEVVNAPTVNTFNKKAVLSQRWPRNAPYRPTGVPWKFRESLTTPTDSQHFSRAFVRSDSMNVPTKFEVRSFTRSWDNRGYPKNLGTPQIRPRSLFSEMFNKLLFGLSL